MKYYKTADKIADICFEYAAYISVAEVLIIATRFLNLEGSFTTLLYWDIPFYLLFTMLIMVIIGGICSVISP